MVDLYINVLVKEPNRNPKLKRIRNEIARINKVLGSEDFELIEYDKNSFIIYDYNSKSKQQIQIGKYFFKGTIIIIGNNTEQGDFKSLTKEQIKDYTKELSAKNTRVIKENIKDLEVENEI